MSTARFVQQFDVEPQFWQFLRGLQLDDLIIELIQNELDANSSHTEITFHPDRLVCQGNGEPISEDGWDRLTYIIGAGDQVASKKSRIGVKNHGLKACFQLGDEIILRSAGHKIIQTLFKDGSDKPPSPGAHKAPLPDQDAPANGTSVEIPFRTRKLIVCKGEPFELEPANHAATERIFRNACKHLPKRLLGVVRHGIRGQYTLCLHHHSLGSMKLHWQARRGQQKRGKGNRQFTLFSRVCEVSSDIPGLSSKSVHEQACTFRIPFPVGSSHEIPEFFARDRQSFLAEIAWATDKRRKPCTTQGTRRYPIGYVATSKDALTGIGVHFSGPYVSNAERHGISEAATLNSLIDNSCKDALVDIMASYLLQRHGGKVLELYMSTSQQDKESLEDLVQRTIHKRALPILEKSRRRISPKRRVALGPRQSSAGEVRRIVLPMYTRDNEQFSDLLSELCPAVEDQIDRKVPGPVLKCLAQYMYDHGYDAIITFDEKDVIARLQPTKGSNYFPWANESEWQASLGTPAIARKYLDVVCEVRFRCDINKILARDSAYLPDSNSMAQPLAEMWSAKNLPPMLGEKQFVPILHPEVLKHPIFLWKPSWKPKPYTLDDYLDAVHLETAPIKSRRQFWCWLRNNWRGIPPKTLSRITHLPVWPSTDDQLLEFDALCKPHDEQIVKLLHGYIHVPSPEILQSGLVNQSGTQLKFRHLPRRGELKKFLSMRMLAFPTLRLRSLSAKNKQEFHKFEGDLFALASKPDLRKEMSRYGVALDGDGHLRTPNDLVRNEGTVCRLHLPARHLIDRPMRELDRIEGWAPRKEPTLQQVEDAFREDGRRFSAHVPRLREYVRQASKEGIPADSLCQVPCIPVEDQLYAPEALALPGKANYWGDWKKEIVTTGIDNETKRIYQKVGVIGGEPKAGESREFFCWLSSQVSQTIASHTDRVLRHIGHRHGPLEWNNQYSRIPFIPVETDGAKVRLVTKAEANRSRSRIVIPDFPELEEEIRKVTGKWPVSLAIVERRNVTRPITSDLRQLGMTTLSDFAGDPARVAGHGNVYKGDEKFQRILTSLCTGVKGNQLQKRLSGLQLDINQDKLRTNWRDRLSKIQQLKVADTIEATYNVSRRWLSLAVDNGFDKKSGTLWLKNGSALQEGFFEAIVNLIFEVPRKYLGAVLEKAYKVEMRERPQLEYAADDQVAELSNDMDSKEDSDQNESVRGSRDITRSRNTVRNIPKQGPIPNGSDTTRNTNWANRKANDRPLSEREKVQIDDLKENQYAWHCQVCISLKEPIVLAPSESYVAGAQNRQRIMEAHHCDPFASGGARHAGNLILLCYYHHQQFHQELSEEVSRSVIAQALLHAEDCSMTFNSIDAHSLQAMEGKVIKIHVHQHRTPISLFFTEEHADYWLKQAKEDGFI